MQWKQAVSFKRKDTKCHAWSISIFVYLNSQRPKFPSASHYSLLLTSFLFKRQMSLISEKSRVIWLWIDCIELEHVSKCELRKCRQKCSSKWKQRCLPRGPGVRPTMAYIQGDFAERGTIFRPHIYERVGTLPKRFNFLLRKIKVENGCIHIKDSAFTARNLLKYCRYLKGVPLVWYKPLKMKGGTFSFKKGI